MNISSIHITNISISMITMYGPVCSAQAEPGSPPPWPARCRRAPMCVCIHVCMSIIIYLSN